MGIDTLYSLVCVVFVHFFELSSAEIGIPRVRWYSRIEYVEEREDIKKSPADFAGDEAAPQVGLEPTTYGLTVRRSNQLSY